MSGEDVRPHTDQDRTGLWRWDLSGQPDRREWTSPVVEEPRGITHLVPSWDVVTPPGCWVEVSVRGRASSDEWSAWLALATWASGDETIHRTSYPRVQDGPAHTAQDEVVVDKTTPWVAWQVRVRSHARAVDRHRTVDRSTEPGHGPRWRSVSVSSAHLGQPPGEPPDARPPAGHAALHQPVLINVPPLSQQRHRGRLRQLNGGGANWCSPTCVTMVLAHWGRAPEAAELGWLEPGYPDPEVAEVTRGVFDARPMHTGNWSFNVAYAASRGLDAYVTRLRHLGDVEDLVRAGVPVVCSVAFLADELTGAGYDTDGHLMVVVGFDEAGDVIVNDPAAHGADTSPSAADDVSGHGNEAVRTTYRRDQFERVWRRGSGGVVYVIGPPGLVAQVGATRSATGEVADR